MGGHSIVWSCSVIREQFTCLELPDSDEGVHGTN